MANELNASIMDNYHHSNPDANLWQEDLEPRMCPCDRPMLRFLAEDEPRLWEAIYTCSVLVLMLTALLSDRVGADAVMVVAVTAFMAADILTLKEGIAGFSNEGLLTVLTLFVVAEGINKTGALDWYMGKLLGRPSTPVAAQFKLMMPIITVSAFLNNTPVVAVMIPIVQRWAKNIGISPQQLLIPLSFASILGGTCTLIGTSTNLVVVGLLNERYPDDPEVEIGLFDMARVGVPIALAGVSYILLASPFLLPGGTSRKEGDRGSVPIDSQEEVLLGARLAPWSPAAGRSVKRSGLRDSGGIYLVSVVRAATGNVHRAVGQDFVLNVGDVLYFTSGDVQVFGEFCEEHGLEVLTNENVPPTEAGSEYDSNAHLDLTSGHNSDKNSKYASMPKSSDLGTVAEDGCNVDGIPCEIGLTKESLMRADEAERSRSISRMTDLIRGTSRNEPADADEFDSLAGKQKIVEFNSEAPKVVVTSDHEFVVIGVDANDRPGLLLDVSKCLLRLNLTLRHTEAAAVGSRSISIWRCELIDSNLPDLEEMWSVLSALLENEQVSQAAKRRGLKVIRAVVTKSSSLLGKTATEVNFRSTYKAAIVAVQKAGRNVDLPSVRFDVDDVLVLQAEDDSPLLTAPPAEFYKRGVDGNNSEAAKSTSMASLVNRLTRKNGKAQNQTDAAAAISPNNADGTVFAVDTSSNEESSVRNSTSGEEQQGEDRSNGDIEAVETGLDQAASDEAAWKDLRVYFNDQGKNGGGGEGTREFLAAMEVALRSKLAKKTIAEAGLDKLPGVYLVSIDRPLFQREQNDRARPRATDVLLNADGSEIASLPTIDPTFAAIAPNTPLMEGDVLWFAGSASAVGDLRKIPGLVSYESSEVAKMAEKVHDRRLVEAVIARRGPLVGKTVKEVKFRTHFGAAVIAVHRDGSRVHDHPGKIKLQAGDVLLLEAGPTFIKRTVENNRAFALLAEVKDSAPPRMRLLIPALIITAAMLAVFTSGLSPSLLICALVACVLMVAMGILSEQEARNAVNWEVYITIAGAFGIGTALVNSGVASGIAGFLVDIGDALNIGDAGLLGAVYFATFLISNVVTNNAAAALLFPVALDAAEQAGISRVTMSYCVMFGASASFMSPFGYTTNLLIYGVGGYKTKDFFMIGTPLQLVLWILSVLFLSIADTTPWYVTWLGAAVALAAVVLFRVADLSSLSIFQRKEKKVDVPLSTN